MNNSVKMAFLPLGIGLATIGIIFGLQIHKGFYSFVLIGLIFVVISAIVAKR